MRVDDWLSDEAIHPILLMLAFTRYADKPHTALVVNSHLESTMCRVRSECAKFSAFVTKFKSRLSVHI